MDLPSYNVIDLSPEKLTEFLLAHKSFEITDLPGGVMYRIEVENLEKLIDELGMKSRIYTRGRKALLAASVFGPTALFGAASAIAMGAHNIATWNPDYEIGKDIKGNTITLEYKK